MTIEFQCDGCLKTLRTADDKAGRTARCPQCGKPLTVPDAPPAGFEPAPAPPQRESHLSDFEELAQAPPRRRPKREPAEITCPMCGEVNDGTTDRCLACGEPLDHDLAQSPGGLSTSYSDICSRAWEIWTANLGINVGAAAIFAVIYIGMSMAMNLVSQLIMVAAIEGVGGVEGMIIVIVLQLLLSIVTSLVIGYLLVGFAQFALENVRRENPVLGSMFISGSKILAIWGTMLCYGIISMLAMVPGFGLMIGGIAIDEGGGSEGLVMFLVFAGLALMLLGAFVATALYWPLPFMLADRSSGLFRSLVDAPKLGMRFFGLSAALVLSWFALYFGGILACCIGLLFSMPLAAILFAVSYERCRLSMKHARA